MPPCHADPEVLLTRYCTPRPVDVKTVHQWTDSLHPCHRVDVIDNCATQNTAKSILILLVIGSGSSVDVHVARMDARGRASIRPSFVDVLSILRKVEVLSKPRWL